MSYKDLVNERGEIVARAYYDGGMAQPPVETHRIGRFTISHDLIERDWREVAYVLAGMLVVRAEMKYDRMVIEYTALCDDFDEVSKGMVPPEYRAIITRDDANNLTVEWRRAD